MVSWKRGWNGPMGYNDLYRVVDALPGLVCTALPDGDINFLSQSWRE